MENVIRLNNTNSNEQSVIDQIASIKAQISELAAVEKSILANLKAQGAGTYKGSAHNLVISESSRYTLDLKAVRKKLCPDFIKVNTKVTSVLTARLFDL